MFSWFKKKTKKETVINQATEAVIESMLPEVKEKSKHIDCECKECIKRIKQNAK